MSGKSLAFFLIYDGTYYYLTIRASLAPRDALFLLKGPKGPFVHPATQYFYSRAKGPFHVPRDALFLLKGLKGPSVHPVTN